MLRVAPNKSGGSRRSGPDDHIRLRRHQLMRELRQPTWVACGTANLINDVAPLDMPDPRELAGNLKITRDYSVSIEKDADTGRTHLCAQRQRIHDRRAA